MDRRQASMLSALGGKARLVLVGDVAQLGSVEATREGRQQLSDTIRAALLREGQLGDEAMTATVLKPCGLGRAEAARATSYTPGDIVTFRQQASASPGPASATGWRRATPRRAPCGWSPRAARPTTGSPRNEAASVPRRSPRSPRSSAKATASSSPRNNCRADRKNGHTARVVAVDPQGSSTTVERQDGWREMLDLHHLADRHIRPGWVRTIHSAQGRRPSASSPT